MNKILLKLIISCLLTCNFSVYAISDSKSKKNKLMVGIVIDQMRYDYIYRFWDHFSNNGFKKLIKEGHFYRNCQFGYVPTYTGPGHASIFTGTTPSVHGIIANDWFDKKSQQYIYCAGDGEMHTICNCNDKNIDIQSKDGKMSPHNMLTTTIGDELKLFNSQSKVFGISLKDRGAILPAGHSADAAYWLDSDAKWISSSYYMNKLPYYIEEINNLTPASNYLKGKWSDNINFSHDLDKIYTEYGAKEIKNTPYGNTILKDLALKIIKEENLGSDYNTDLLTISFSSTDYIGHKYGPHAAEIKDTYIRLDKDISEIINFLEEKVNKNNLIIFLTSDHGVVSEPSELIKRKIPGGYYNANKMIRELEEHLMDVYKWPINRNDASEYILNYSNNQIFLNHDYIKKNLDINLSEFRIECANFLLNYEWVKNTYTRDQLHNNEYQNSFHSLIQRGFNQKRSGDVILSIQSGWLKEYWEKGGTTHGSCFSYDTHVPLIFWGGDIKKGVTDRRVNIRDIAPTLSNILGISFPNGSTGNPLIEITQ